MPAHQSEWLIRPSRYQQRLDASSWFLSAVLLFVALDGGWTLLSLIPIGAGLLTLLMPRSLILMGKNRENWWLWLDGEKHEVRFQHGSVRRRQYVKLVWGFWPWQVLVIRPDSFQNAEPYLHLKYELYGSV